MESLTLQGPKPAVLYTLCDIFGRRSGRARYLTATEIRANYVPMLAPLIGHPALRSGGKLLG